MAKLISLHSFRGGTGKSNITANLSAVLALAGKRIAIIDTDIQSPGIHIIFGLNEDLAGYTLNDYLWGKCRIEEAAYDVTPQEAVQGKIFLVPSSIKINEISRILHEGYDARLLKDGFKALVRSLSLDYLIIDTHPGLNEETLLSIAISNILIIILRPDQQDLQGTSVTLEVARKLGVPTMFLVLNKILPDGDFKAYRTQLEQTYNTEIGALLPLATEIVRLASSGIFYLQSPKHRFSKEIKALGDKILAVE
ncbi:MAG: MinD/ParA family protein [Anaerolineae bacterium]|nr:MinD/ParA family protein [Anaerolineae bacterium]